MAWESSKFICKGLNGHQVNTVGDSIIISGGEQLNTLQHFHSLSGDVQQISLGSVPSLSNHSSCVTSNNDLFLYGGSSSSPSSFYLLQAGSYF